MVNIQNTSGRTVHQHFGSLLGSQPSIAGELTSVLYRHIRTQQNTHRMIDFSHHLSDSHLPRTGITAKDHIQGRKGIVETMFLPFPDKIYITQMLYNTLFQCPQTVHILDHRLEFFQCFARVSLG